MCIENQRSSTVTTIGSRPRSRCAWITTLGSSITDWSSCRAPGMPVSFFSRGIPIQP